MRPAANGPGTRHRYRNERTTSTSSSLRETPRASMANTLRQSTTDCGRDQNKREPNCEENRDIPRHRRHCGSSGMRSNGNAYHTTKNDRCEDNAPRADDDTIGTCNRSTPGVGTLECAGGRASEDRADAECGVHESAGRTGPHPKGGRVLFPKQRCDRGRPNAGTRPQLGCRRTDPCPRCPDRRRRRRPVGGEKGRIGRLLLIGALCAQLPRHRARGPRNIFARTGDPSLRPPASEIPTGRIPPSPLLGDVQALMWRHRRERTGGSSSGR